MGVLLVYGYFLSLALVVAAPVIVNIFLFHILVQLPTGTTAATIAAIEVALGVGAPYCYLVYVYRHHFLNMLSP